MKTREEIILDNKYFQIMEYIEDILELVGIDKTIIDRELDNQEILQTSLDYILLGLIGEIIERESD